MKEFDKEELKEKLKNVQSAFKSFDKIELKGRKYIQEAILGCYDIYLHYNEKLIKKRCKKAGIKYKVKKPMKMILMLAMGVFDDCDDERVKARIRTYVRVLKQFDSLGYELDEAEENLSKFGIDYFANPRSKEQSQEEETEDDENQLELDLGDNESDEDEEEEDDDENEETDNNEEDNEVAADTEDLSLSSKIVKFFRANKIRDNNYVIWVNDGEACKSVDTSLLRKLDDFEFMKLK